VFYEWAERRDERVTPSPYGDSPYDRGRVKMKNFG
jgi:hypothetical protein